jgi:hypothetical protein
MERGYRNIHSPALGQMVKVSLESAQLKPRPDGLEEKNHSELRMDDRLFNIDDVQSFLKEKAGHL